MRGKLNNECHEYGYDIARKSGRRSSDPAVLKALGALAESKAQALANTISQNALDKLLRDLKACEEMLDQRVLHRDGAATRLHAARLALSHHAEIYSASTGESVARVLSGASHGSSSTQDETALRNAAVLRAAPELHASLKRMMSTEREPRPRRNPCFCPQTSGRDRGGPWRAVSKRMGGRTPGF
ncbi:MAG: hypothetical protein ABI824_07315 [Acidobacteriota bacterium]